MATKEKNPKQVTIFGRLSFPTFTAQEAYDRSLKGSYPAASVDKAKPDFNLLVEQAQLAKLIDHITSEFLPYCEAQDKAGEKRDALSAKEVKDLLAQLQADDFDGPYNTPVKAVPEKTAPLVPEAVASIKCIGPEGANIELKAIVQDETQLAVNDGSQLVFPVIKPINETVHQMYPGAYVAATLNLYAYHNGKLPGFSAGANVAVFKMDGDRIGGGVSIDEDEIFMD